MSALREDNRRLTQTVAELRTDRRARDRKLADLQHQLDELRAKIAASVIDDSVPVLPVEVAGPAVVPAPAVPDDARVVDISEDGTEIVYEGDAWAGRPVARSAAVDGGPPARRPTAPADQRLVVAPPLGEIPVATDRIEVMRRLPPISARAAIRTKIREHEAIGDRRREAGNDYRAAVLLVKAARYDEATAALRAFIAAHPRHDYADNAQYWLGETFYAQKDYVRALTEFRAVVEAYPRGNKVPDALLKVGYCYQAMGQGAKARAMLEHVVNLYPKSEPAMLAAKRLETQ
jgi:tol-pal system protein YbgF